MNFFTIIAIFAIAFVCAVCLMPLIINITHKLGWLEENDERKTHAEEVGNLGGIGIFASFAITLLYFFDPANLDLLIAVSMGLPLLIISLCDDMLNIGITLRLVVQALLGVILFELGFPVISLEGYWMVNLAATVLFVIVLINAYNFIDGINGLAGGLGMIAGIACGCILAGRGELKFALFCFAYAGSLFGFLVYNFGKKARIFMGDNGSTVLGYLIAVMLLVVTKSDHMVGEANASWPVLLAMVIVPVVDIFKVAVFRMLRLQSPFSPDRTHVHHLLTDRLFSHPVTCAILYGWTMLVIAVAWSSTVEISFAVVSIIAVGPYLIAIGCRATRLFTKAGAADPKQIITLMQQL